MREPKFSLYKKLCVMFLIALIPVAAISLIMNQVGSQRVQQQSIEKMQMELFLKAQDFDNELQRINAGLNSHVLDGAEEYLGANFHAISSYELGQRVSELNKELGGLSIISDCIEDVAVYFPHIGRKLAVSRYYSDTISESDMQRISQYNYRDSGISYGDNSLWLHAVAPTSQGNVPTYILEVKMSKEKILSFLDDTEDEHYLLMGSDWMIASVDSELVEPVLEDVRDLQNQSKSFIEAGTLFNYQRLALCDGWVVSCTKTFNLFQEANIFRFFIFAVLFITGTAMLVVTFWLSKSIHRPFRQLLSLFQEVKQGGLDVQTNYQFRDEFVVIFEQFDKMLDRIRKLIAQSVEQEKELKEAEYKQLQAHIAPHFLYNSFNVLRHCLLMEDYDSAEEMARLLGNYFRYITYSGEQSSISMLEEYQHMVDYLKIQQIRFQDKIEVEMDELPQEFYTLKVPPFVLQPLVENNFKHGVQNMTDGGKISVRISQKEKTLQMSVRDNGQGMASEDLEKLHRALQGKEVLAEHSGLVNINKRLKMLLGDEATLEVASEEGCFFEAVIRFPINEEQIERNGAHD